MKTRKFISELDYDAEFIVFEISSVLNELKICHQLNKKLRLHFERLPDLLLSASKNPEPYLLFCYDLNDRTSFYLLSRADQSHLIMPSYFLLVKNLPVLLKPDSLMDEISGISGITSVNRIDYPVRDSRPLSKNLQKMVELFNSLFMDLEYHLMDLSKKAKGKLST